MYPLPLPAGLGLEAAGIIKKVGSKVKNWSVGDHVAYAGVPIGAYAESRAYPADKLVKVPDHVTSEIAASIMTKGLTVHYLLFKTYKIKAGETVLFHAAAGGVGQIFCQWAKSIGCKIIGTVGSDDKINIAKKNGCDFVINYSKDDFVKKVLEITKGKGVPVVYDGVGADTFEGSLKCLAPFGVLASFGAASGAPPELKIGDLAKKSLYVTRPGLGPHTATSELTEEISSPLFDAIKNGLSIPINHRYALKDAAEAHRDLQSRKTTGSAILDI